MGSLPGVVSTRSAWHEGHEVVEVGYLPSRIEFGALVDYAKSKSCSTRVFTTTDEQLETARARIGDAAKALVGSVRVSKDSDQLYYLARSPLRYLPLTPLQSRRVNGALGTKQDPARWLSPRQRDLALRLERVAKQRGSRLDELERPDSIPELIGYQARLEAKLDAIDK